MTTIRTGTLSESIYRKALSALFLLLLSFLILAFPLQAVSYAYTGLDIWFSKMLPTLLPFMIISSLIIAADLHTIIISILSPILCPIYKLSKHCIYSIVIGFSCGFPLGAKSVADLYKKGDLSYQEASLCLAFCNNLGPVYFNGFILTGLGIENKLMPLLGMYGIPLLYGLILRYTKYAGLIPDPLQGECRPITNRRGVATTAAADMNHRNASMAAAEPTPPNLLDNAICGSLVSISKLAGYMVFFNLLNLIPYVLFGDNSLLRDIIALFLEISSGAGKMLSGFSATSKASAYVVLFTALSFSGCSCAAQTGSVLAGTGLSLKSYILHRVVIASASFLYYCIIFL